MQELNVTTQNVSVLDDTNFDAESNVAKNKLYSDKNQYKANHVEYLEAPLPPQDMVYVPEQ